MAQSPPRKMFAQSPASGANNTPLGWSKLGPTGTNGNMESSQYGLSLGAGPFTAYGENTSSGGMWECVIVQNSSVPPFNKTGTAVTPLFFVCPDIRGTGLEEFIGLIPGMPAYDPVVTRGSLVSGMLKGGWSFHMRDGRAPINVPPLLSYDFTDPRCFDPGGSGVRRVNDLSGNGFNGDIEPDAAGLFAWSGQNSTGGVGINMQDANTWINIPGNLRPTTRNVLTYSVLAQRNNASGAQYLWDARNCGGTWMLTEYSGYDFNNGNAIRQNTSPVNGYNLKFHYLQTQGPTNNLAFFNKSGDGGSVQGTTPGGPWGNNFRIGTRYTNSSRWNGWYTGFWIYDGELTKDECSVVNYFNYYYWRSGN